MMTQTTGTIKNRVRTYAAMNEFQKTFVHKFIRIMPTVSVEIFSTGRPEFFFR